MTLTGRTTLKIWLVLLVVFVLGSVTGAALTGLYRSRAGGGGAEARERAMHERFEKMRSELSLTDQQTTSVRTILDETRNEYRALRAKLLEKIIDIHVDGYWLIERESWRSGTNTRSVSGRARDFGSDRRSQEH